MMTRNLNALAAVNSCKLLGLALVLVISACSSNDSEEELGPAPLVEFDEQRIFNKQWSTSLGDGPGDIYNRLKPAIDDDTLYVASVDGSLAAVSLVDGDILWEVDVDTDQLIVGGVGIGETVLMLGVSSGEVMAFNKDNGEWLWSSDVGGEVLAAPQSKDELVFVQTFDGQMLALDITTGERVWSYRNTMPVLTLRGTSTPYMFRDSVIAGFANGQVVSFEMTTGSVRWSTRVAVAKGDSEIERIIDIDGDFLESNGLLYAVTYQGKIAAIDPSSGRRLWVNEASSYVGMSQGFGNIYVTGEDGSVTAFEKNGEGARWAQTVLARRKLSGSATLGSYVVMGDLEGYLHALSQVDGQIVARTHVDSDGVRVDLQTANDMLIVYSNSGRLIAYTIDEKASGFSLF